MKDFICMANIDILHFSFLKTFQRRDGVAVASQVTEVIHLDQRLIARQIQHSKLVSACIFLQLSCLETEQMITVVEKLLYHTCLTHQKAV
jgi:hypothetical protein